MSLFQKLIGSTGLTTVAAAAPAVAAAPSADAPAGDAGALTETQIEAALQAARAEGVAEGTATGATAERDRTAAVFASEEGKANMTMAAWMLASSPTATSDSIIAQLKGLPVQAAAAAPAPEAAAPAKQSLAATPKVDLNGSAPGSQANDDTQAPANSNQLWDKVQASGADRFVMGAANASPITVPGSGQTIPRTGN